MLRPNPFFASEPQAFSDGPGHKSALVSAASFHAGKSAGLALAARMVGPGKQLETARGKQSLGPGKQASMLFGKVGPSVMSRFGEGPEAAGPFD